MKMYVVVSIDNANDFYFTSDLNELISEMYSQELFDNEFEVVKGWFFNNFKVFSSNSYIEKVHNYL